MDIKEVEKIVSSIQAKLFKNSNAQAVGMFKSQLKGSGLQFREHQVYNHGDDVRFIDWKVSARNPETYIRTFEEERNVDIQVCIDLSEAVLLGYQGKTKLEAMLQLTCLVYLLAQESHDQVSVNIFFDKLYRLPAQKGKEGIITLISFCRRLGILTEEGHINLNLEVENILSFEDRIKFIQELVSQRKEVILFSDYSNWKFDNIKIFDRKNLHLFQILSPLEELDQYPFSLYVRGKNKSWFTTAFSQKKKESDPLHRRVHRLLVNDRYLEGFIKEMLHA